MTASSKGLVPSLPAGGDASAIEPEATPTPAARAIEGVFSKNFRLDLFIEMYSFGEVGCGERGRLARVCSPLMSLSTFINTAYESLVTCSRLLETAYPLFPVSSLRLPATLRKQELNRALPRVPSVLAA